MNPLLIVIFIICIAGLNVVGQEQLLPKENEIPGWTLIDTTSCFNGHAKDCTSLYDIIDGGADRYLDRGFVSGIFRGYVDDNAQEICVEIYNQNTKENAQSVYKALDESEYVIYDDIGDQARLDTKILSDYVLEVTQNGYFMRFVCPKEDKYKDEMINIVKSVVKNVRSSPIVNFQKKNKFSKNIKISIENIQNNKFQFKFSVNSELNRALYFPVIKLYNSKGSLIRTLRAKRSTSEYLVTWDGKNNNSISVTQGVYTVSIQFPDYSVSEKFLVQ